MVKISVSVSEVTALVVLQRAKEIARNKKERKFQRDAHKMKSDPDALKEELKEVLELEEEGKLNLTVRLKKRALQGAYDLALKKKKVRYTSMTRIYGVSKRHKYCTRWGKWL